MVTIAELTHFNEQGHSRMVDISAKEQSHRTAIAHSSISVHASVHQQITEGKNKKGDVLAVAQIAGIMAAKQTASLIPMCHPIPLTSVNITNEWTVDHSTETYRVLIQAEVKTIGSTGVEMEALVAASTTALTIYDMCKAAGKEMIIGPTMLLSKTGGKNGDYTRKGS